MVSCSDSAWDTLETASLVQHPQQLSSRGGTLHCIFPDMKDLCPGDAGGHIPVGANHREYRAGRMQPTAVGEGTQEGTEVSELHRGTSVMAEAHGLVWRRTASHLLSHCLSTLPRASPGQGSLDQGLVKQIQQLGDTAVGDANQRRHLLSWTLLLVNIPQHKQVYALHGRARGSGSLYQNTP